MKLSEVRVCDGCDKKLAPQGQFYVLRMSMALINSQAFREVHALTQMFNGNLAVAEAMAPNADAITIAGDKEPSLWSEYLICRNCGHGEKELNLGLMMEKRSARVNAEEKEEDQP